LQKFFTRIVGISSCLWLLAGIFTPILAAPEKDQSRIGPQIGGQSPSKKPDPLLPEGLEQNEDSTSPEAIPNSKTLEEEFSDPSAPYDINDIPALERLELTIDIAKRAIDAFADIGSRYDDKGLYDYPTLEEYVKKTEPGKQLEADVKKYGFKDVIEWNTAIMNVSFAFGSLLNDQEADIRGQIESVREDKTLSAEKKQRIIASLTALIPTKENVEIIRELQKLPIYKQKLNLLDAFE